MFLCTDQQISNLNLKNVSRETIKGNNMLLNFEVRTSIFMILLWEQKLGTYIIQTDTELPFQFRFKTSCIRKPQSRFFSQNQEKKPTKVTK